MVLLQIVFWLCVFVLGYVYVGYPLLARVFASIVGKPVRRASFRPTVTIVIAAYNEEKGIRAKLDNVGQLDYPRELIDVIVTSDASSDSTDEIVRAYDPGRVQLLRIEGRQGKTACQNAAAAIARGEVILFTDATTNLKRDALTAMVENFADPDVGCVAGSLVYEAKDTSLTAQGGTQYWGYEISLRRAESLLGSLVGVSGCLYAVRRSAYPPIPPRLISDFVIAMRIYEKGMRTVLEPKGICFEDTLQDRKQELSMRVRVAVRSINALVAERRLLNPFRHPRFAWQMWSHKVLRYASPYFWMGALVSSLALAWQPLYLAAFIAQLAVLGGGLLGALMHSRSRSLGVLGKPYYFLLTNVASLIATFRYLKGERMVTWKPIR